MRSFSALVLLVAACHADPPVSRGTPHAATSSPATVGKSVTAPSTDPPVSRPLPVRLQAEAAARPGGALRAEELVAALEKRGVHVSRTRQVLASTVGASYCAMVMTEKGLGLALCEYPTPGDAELGLGRSHARFDHLAPGRTLVVGGQSLLTISPHQGDALAGEARVTAELFASLTNTNKGDR